MYAVSLVVLYVGIILFPFLVIFGFGLSPGRHFLTEIGRSFALCAFCIIALQPVLSARFKWIDRPFGFEIVSRFHKRMGLFAGTLLVCHPLFIAAGDQNLSLITTLSLPWNVLMGKAALLLLIVQVGLGIYWERLGSSFESWRRSHFMIAPLILIAAFVHSWFTGGDLSAFPMQITWTILVVTGALTFSYHKIVKPRKLREKPYTVSSVEQETHNVWTIKLAPPEGEPVYSYLPGQFHFLTFHRDPSLPIEEHHWTISSSPTQREYLSTTIKESGDYTATIGKTKPGDAAVVEGPFGRFSYVLHPADKDLVFIAGGIGITPVMAMLRHMRDVRFDGRVMLIYANRTEHDIAFRQELEDIESGGQPDLKIVHVLSEPRGEWKGERGYVTGELLERYCGSDLKLRTYYVCGPPAMAGKVVDALRERGVPYRQIRTEQFSL